MHLSWNIGHRDGKHDELLRQDHREMTSVHQAFDLSAEHVVIVL